ncbi:hypothetical protein B0H17DRAFT_1147511 [Mycena rosella]|uniref:Uncharacterized protein n=1 Tax=Mycena rosella TaxID=1033263 RepID=A0AAD7CLN1_MYCRO|nr:hypothetical protein B0H17DRAFT_1147511 [Mycena rosella]
MDPPRARARARQPRLNIEHRACNACEHCTRNACGHRPRPEPNTRDRIPRVQRHNARTPTRPHPVRENENIFSTRGTHSARRGAGAAHPPSPDGIELERANQPRGPATDKYARRAWECIPRRSGTQRRGCEITQPPPKNESNAAPEQKRLNAERGTDARAGPTPSIGRIRNRALREGKIGERTPARTARRSSEEIPDLCGQSLQPHFGEARKQCRVGEVEVGDEVNDARAQFKEFRCLLQSPP